MNTFLLGLLLGAGLTYYAMSAVKRAPEQDHEQATGPKLVEDAETETPDEWGETTWGRA